MRDITPEAIRMIRDLLAAMPRALDDMERLLGAESHLRRPHPGRGRAHAGGGDQSRCSGPVARASGVTRDLRRDEPYLAYADFDFQVCCAAEGDCLARYRVRMAEMWESIKIIHQAMENLPAGPVNVGPGARAILPPKGAVWTTIEGLISHFELVMTNRGFQTPSEEVYVATEAPNGELGFYIVGDGSQTAYRARCRPPSFIHFAMFPALDPRPHAERRGGRAGEPEHHRRGVGPMSENVQDADAGRACAGGQSAAERRGPGGHPRLFPPLSDAAGGGAAGPARGQRAPGLRAAAGGGRDRRAAGLAPAQVQDTLSFYGFFHQDEPQGRYRVWVCRSISCAACGGEEMLDYLAQRLGIRPGQTTPDGRVSLQFAECLGVCESAPAMLVNETLYKNLTKEKIDQFVASTRKAESPLAKPQADGHAFHLIPEPLIPARD